MRRRVFGVMAGASALVVLQPVPAASYPVMDAAMIVQELREFGRFASVLYVAAHPDDENTRLITYLVRGRGYRTGYLSLTRGDGGQNLIGPELGPVLGVIRTQELLAARRIDGGEQFFSRAIDFGYSKESRETLDIWDRDAVLADMVRVIRTFRPDVIVTRFSPEPGGTHGHHTASAMLAVEAFALAADRGAFAPQLGHLPPWQARRVVWNTYSWRPRATEPDEIEIDVGGYNALLGESYGEIAARARSMHKSQGFGSVGSRGSAMERFRVIAGEPAKADIMDGIDTSWGRVPGGGAIDSRVEAIIGSFNPESPSASVPALLELRAQLARLAGNGTLAYKRRQLDRILQACLGLHVETLVPDAEAYPGDVLRLRHNAVARTEFPVRWTSVRYVGSGDEIVVAADLPVNQPVSREGSLLLPEDTPLSQPYWLRAEGTVGMYRVEDPALIGVPENPPAMAVEHVFEVGGQPLVISDAPEQVIDDPVKGEVRRRLEIVPPVNVAFPGDLALFAPGETRSIEVGVDIARSGAEGGLFLEAPPGWTVRPARQPFSAEAGGSRQRLSFVVTAPPKPARAQLVAGVEVGGIRYRSARREIRYDHIPAQVLQPVASLDAVSLEVEVASRNVGYLPGAGDLVAESLQHLGCQVTPLAAADLTPERLAAFDAVVLGVRAFNTRADLEARFPALLAYVEAGGNLVVQYNTTADLKVTAFGPYPLRLSRDRVTDETAPVTLLEPGHPALVSPNRITAADFEGWVQERGLYFPGQWDDRYVPLLACNDPGEPPTSGGLLVARHGEGWFVYTGLSFFRQLPAGVPGAYRLFANLLSLGK